MTVPKAGGNTVNVSSLLSRGPQDKGKSGGGNEDRVTARLSGAEAQKLSPEAKKITIQDLNDLRLAFAKDNAVTAGGCGGCCCSGGSQGGGNSGII